MEGSSDASRIEGKKSNLITKELCLATFAIIVGSCFQFGYNVGVINSPQEYIKQFFNKTYNERYDEYIDDNLLTILWSFTVAIFAIGGMIGSSIAGPISHRFGRKIVLLCNNALAVSSVVLLGISKPINSYEVLIVGRFMIGINCGINTAVAPMYLTEIAPVQYRGILGTLNQLGIVIAILFSQILGLHSILGNEELWNILLSVPILFSVLQLATLPFCPESPRHLLIVKFDETASVEALLRLRGAEYDASEEVNSMRKEHEEEMKEPTVGLVKIFTTDYLRKPLIIALVMQLSQQLSGINAVFYYSTPLFIEAGIPEEYSDLTTIGVGIVNVVMTLVSLSLIEKAGRRILHLSGLGGMFLCAVVLTVTLNLNTGSNWHSWASLIIVLLFVACFQIGPGSIPWFITAELFTEGPRPTAVGLAGVVNWLGNFIVAIAYPPLNVLIGGYTFAIFAVLLAFFWVYTFFKVPETKGRTVQEISFLFRKNITQNNSAYEKYYSASTQL